MANWAGVLKGAVQGALAGRKKKKKVESVPDAIRKHRVSEQSALAAAGLTEKEMRRFR